MTRDWTLAHTMRASGATLAEIASLYGVTSARIGQVTQPSTIRRASWHDEAATLVASGFPVAAVAARFRKTESYVRTVVRRKGVAIPSRAAVAEHGTRSKYTGGCRCQLCRDANSAWQRSYYAARRVSLEAEA
jgi:hypothetical protein